MLALIATAAVSRVRVGMFMVCLSSGHARVRARST
jgi:hypothetical protein